MLTLRDHTVEDYANLRDMDASDVAVLDEADRACLDELGEYLVSNDAWRRFAIWLLHKHFEPSAGEVFVEGVTTAPRGTQTTLLERCGAPDLSATSMRFDPGISSGVGVIGMEFAHPAEFGSIASLRPDDEAALAGIGERLRARGKIERFGVRLIRNPLGLSEDEVLVETCDIAQRTLRCGVGARRRHQHRRDNLAMEARPEQDRAHGAPVLHKSVHIGLGQQPLHLGPHQFPRPLTTAPTTNQQPQARPRQNRMPCQTAAAATARPTAGSNHQPPGQVAGHPASRATGAACGGSAIVVIGPGREAGRKPYRYSG